jgi:hypothetical protein
VNLFYIFHLRGVRDMPRLKSDIRVAAIIRRAQAAGAFAAVLRKGDADAGAIWVLSRAGRELYRHAEQTGFSGVREWFRDGPFDDAEMTARTNKAVDRDPDLWIVEIDDGQGRAFLDGELAKAETASEAAAKALFRGR